MKKSVAVFVAVFMLLGFGGAGLAQIQSPQKGAINLALGSVSSSSGVYAFAVSLASVIHKYDPEITVTAVEGGGGYDHARLMKQGVLNWSISGSPAVAVAVLEGSGSFKKEGPWEPVRLMFMRNVNVARVYVRADLAQKEGIKSWGDLAGKKFSPGIPGTRDMTRAMNANKVLGTGIQMVPGSLSDSVDNLKRGNLVGMLKGGAHDRFDAAMLECHYSTPLTVIGFKQEEAEKLMAKDPLDSFMETHAGGIRELPKLESLWEMNSVVMTMSSSKMSQEIGYRIVKAVTKGWNEIVVAYPPCKGLDPVKDAFKNAPKGKTVLFHAGIIQYAKEMGIDVPQQLIPPEFKGTK